MKHVYVFIVLISIIIVLCSCSLNKRITLSSLTFIQPVYVVLENKAVALFKDENGNRYYIVTDKSLPVYKLQDPEYIKLTLGQEISKMYVKVYTGSLNRQDHLACDVSYKDQETNEEIYWYKDYEFKVDFYTSESLYYDYTDNIYMRRKR